TDNISILEMDIKAEWAGKTLRELDLRKKYNINIIAFKNSNDAVFANPDIVIENSMKMIVMADKKGADFLK
ncbi:MAG: TrkA C-terminal domain-containing protein, partial [Clostridia bacterium]|nr:TrkA C-terminal domain-containing protein [Clostridia bacterium]